MRTAVYEMVVENVRYPFQKRGDKMAGHRDDIGSVQINSRQNIKQNLFLFALFTYILFGEIQQIFCHTRPAASNLVLLQI